MSLAASNASERVRATAWVFFTLAGSACGITLLYLGMRAVMDVGGACADGGPFVPRVRCPEGVPLVMIGGIWGGIVAVGLYVWKALKYGVPNFVGLAWPALFLSLGWNFFDYGLDAPDGSGIVWGWLVCGALFALMGGLPLIGVLPATIKSFRAGREIEGVPSRPVDALRAVGPTRSRRRRAEQATGFSSTVTPPDGGQPDDLVSALERLGKLHRSGALSDDEFAAAKKRVIDGGGA